MDREVLQSIGLVLLGFSSLLNAISILRLTSRIRTLEKLSRDYGELK